MILLIPYVFTISCLTPSEKILYPPLFTCVLIYEVEDWLFDEKMAPLAGPRDQHPAHPLIPELSDRLRSNRSRPNRVSSKVAVVYIVSRGIYFLPYRMIFTPPPMMFTIYYKLNKVVT